MTRTASSYNIQLGFCSSNAAQSCLCTNCPVWLLSLQSKRGLGQLRETTQVILWKLHNLHSCLFLSSRSLWKQCLLMIMRGRKQILVSFSAGTQGGWHLISNTLLKNSLQLQKALATDSVLLRVLRQWGHHHSYPNNCFQYWFFRHKIYCKSWNPKYKGLFPYFLH